MKYVLPVIYFIEVWFYLDINDILSQGEVIRRKQSCVLDQGFGNQSDGTLYLTNQNLIFHVAQSSIERGLTLKVDGSKDADVEFIHIPLDLVRGVEKKRFSIRVQTGGSLFQERLDRRYLFGPKGEGRVFENGPDTFSFAMNIFVDKDPWVNEIISLRDSIISSTKYEESTKTTEPSVEQKDSPPASIKERIIIREVVKIKCPYCGTLYDQKNDRCPFCGGKH